MSRLPCILFSTHLSQPLGSSARLPRLLRMLTVGNKPCAINVPDWMMRQALFKRGCHNVTRRDRHSGCCTRAKTTPFNSRCHLNHCSRDLPVAEAATDVLNILYLDKYLTL